MILAGFGLASPAAHWGMLLTCLGFTARAPGVRRQWAGQSGRIAVCQAMDQFKYESDHLDFCLPKNHKNTSIRRRSRSFLPYGGATDIHGKILWKVSKEEHDQMMARIKKAFEKE